MPLDTKAPVEIDGSPLPAHLMENFEKAENNIREIYGKSPSASDLLRMWIASATSWDIRVEFEEHKRKFLGVQLPKQKLHCNCYANINK